MTLIITAMNQVPPVSSSGATVHVSFQISGSTPEFVQIYSAPAGGGVGTATLRSVVSIKSGTSQYNDNPISVPAGVYLAVYVCPRDGSQSQPDDTTDGSYWEDVCAVAYIATLTKESPPATLASPVIVALVPFPANLKQSNRMTVMWKSSTSYDKYVLGWLEDGMQSNPQTFDYSKVGNPWNPAITTQGSIDISESGTSGQYQIQTNQKTLYFFRVNGGISQFWNYKYSAWGPTAALIACSNLRSLRLFISSSGTNPLGLGIRSLVSPGQSVRNLMQI